MAYTDSPIGFATQTLAYSTPPGYVDSLIGYVTGSLSNPVRADSLIGYRTVTIVDPTGRSNSAVGYATLTLLDPVLPLKVLTGTGWKDAPLLFFNGSTWS